MNIRQLPPTRLALFRAENPDALLVDVREPWEHRLASIGASLLIPLGTLAATASDLLEDPDRTIIVYCHHGIRSLQACGLLATMGYSDLVNLDGGIDRYSRLVDPTVPLY